MSCCALFWLWCLRLRCDSIRRRRPLSARWRADGAGWLGPVWRAGAVYLFGILASTVIASAATAPFAAAHFHAIAVYGPAANLAAMPVMALWVMPWLAAALLLMPVGGEALAFAPLRWGLQAVETVARTVADWPHATLAVPPMPTAVLALTALCGLWLCVWRRAWRFATVPVMAALLVVPWLLPRPDLVISGDGTLLAVRSGPGLVLSPGRNDSFARMVWQEMHGVGTGRWEAAGLVEGAPGTDLACDARGCLYRPPGGQVVALVRHEAALGEDCAAADLVVATVPVQRRDCLAPALITTWDLWRKGAHAVYLRPGGLPRVETVQAYRGRRPWSMGPAD